MKATAAHTPASLLLCARTALKAEAFIAELRKQHPQTTTKPVNLDLASFDSIKSAARRINDSCDKIDVLILNAGLSSLSAQTTKEGYEIQFGTNHVGHALLTQLLMPKVLAASKAWWGCTNCGGIVGSSSEQGTINRNPFSRDED